MDLRKWLQRAGISQRELARRVGYTSNGPLSAIIRGEASIPKDQVLIWSDALDLKDAEKTTVY